MNIDILLDVFILGSGIYLIYAGAAMKKTGKVKNVLVSKDVDLKKAVDVPGFIQNTFLKTIIMGVLGTAAGCVGLYNDYYGGIGKIQLAVILVYGICLMLYGYVTVRAQKKYLQV
ncbi:MAG: hypothetical protein J6B10_00175 [Lachnospiraceae bacterium]|nr:hypothetical protein [Lachnospiraceae bacterium]